jgi:hypothetical protein
MRKLTLRVMLLAILLFGGCAHNGQPTPSYPAPGASQPDKPGNSGTGGGGEM